MRQGTSVFISYAREDRDFVQRLHEALGARGKSSWVDWEGIPPSAEWMAEIHAAIDAADTFLLVISPDSASSEVCGQEIEFAHARRKRLVPIVYRDADRALPDAAARLNWVFLREHDDFERGLAALVEALDTDLDWVRLHTRLLVRAQAWVAQTRDGDSLLRGKDLAEAERWLLGSADETDAQRAISPLHRDYIAASRTAATTRQRRLLGASLSALAIVAVLAVLAWSERNDARSRELAALSRERLADDPELAGLLARESFAAGATPEADTAMRLAALQLRHQRWAVRDLGSPNSLAVAAEGKVLVATSAGVVTLWDADTGAPLHRIDATGGRHAAVAADGRTAIIGGMVSGPAGTPNSGDTHRAQVIDLNTGRQLAELASPDEQIMNVHPSHDGRRLVTTSYAPLAQVWDTASGRLLAQLRTETDKVVTQLLISHDDRHVVAGSEDGPAIVWQTETGQRVCRVAGTAAGWVLAISPDDSLFVTADEADVRLWQTRDCQLVAQLKGHASNVYAADFSPDGRHLLTAGNDGTVRLWATAGGQPQAVLQGHTDAVRQARFDPTGRRLASASADGTLRLWDATSGAPLLRLTGHVEAVVDLVFTHGGRRLASLGQDGSLRSWELQVPPLERVLTGHPGRVNQVRFGPDNRTLLTTSDDQTARLWTVDSQQPGPVLEGHRNFLAPSAFGPGGQVVATAGRDGLARLWRVADGQLLGTLSGHRGAIVAVAFSPDGSRLLTAGSDQTARLWRVDTQALERTLPVGAHQMAGAAFSPDGALLAVQTMGGGTGELPGLHLFTVADGQPLASCDIRPGYGSPEFSPDGRLLALRTSDERVAVLPVREAGAATLLGGEGKRLKSVSFSHDGSRLLTAGGDGSARLRPVHGKNPGAVVMKGHPRGVAKALLSPDDRVVVTLGEDWSARVWQADGRPIRLLARTRDAVNDAAFSPDGAWLALASSDRTLRVYPREAFAPTAEVAGLLAARIGRDFSDDERRFVLNELWPRLRGWVLDMFTLPDIGS